MLRNKEWQVEGNSVLKEEKMYISRDKKLRTEIVQLHHDVLVAGYKE